MSVAIVSHNLLQKIWPDSLNAGSRASNGSVRPVRRRIGAAVAWLPTHDSYYRVASLRTAADLPGLYVTQAALLAFEASIRGSSTRLPYGLLAGQLCVCPDTNERYLLIDDVGLSDMELSDSDIAVRLPAALRALSADAVGRGKVPIGWYVSAVGEELRLEGEDLDLHQKVFPEPWQVVLLHDNSSGVERAAFMRFESMTKRLYASPFFELLPDSASPSDGDATVLRWVNYRSDQVPARAFDEVLDTHAVIEPPSRPAPRVEVEPDREVPIPGNIVAPRIVPNARFVFINGEIVAFSDPTLDGTSR